MSDIRNCYKITLMYITWMLYRVRKLITPKRRLSPRKVCVLYLSGMGDILCDTFFFESLRQKYPGAVLVACIPAAFVGVQKRFFLFDDYIAHDEYIQTLREVNRAKFDLVILPGWLLRNSILALLSNARVILGYINDLSFSNRYLNTFRVEVIGMEVGLFYQDMRMCHLSERPNAIAQALGMPVVDPVALDIHRMANAANYAVVHAGARFPGRRWNAKGYIEIIKWMIEECALDAVYMIGDSLDRHDNTAIIRSVGKDTVHNVAGEMDLTGTSELIATSRIFIGNDSGPMHIAALSGVPTLALMGPNFPYISGPLGVKSRYLFYQFSCSGCNQRGCGFGFRCINAITPDEVTSSIQDMLEQQSPE